ncbi:MAG: lipoate--protein ligase family protein [Limisphaerales bacterium]
MAETWQLLRSGPGSASWNMALDEALLLHAKLPTLRLYSWSEPAATFGYFQRFESVSKETHLRPLVRRCTGGGIVPHDHDWTYSAVFPKGTDWFALKAEESYQQIHEWVSGSFARLQVATRLADCCDVATPGKCFAGFEKHDVLVNGRKVAGAAQRRIRSGLLIQGSIQPPSNNRREQWESAFITEAEDRFGVRWVDAAESLFHPIAGSLDEEKYATDEHNRRR